MNLIIDIWDSITHTDTHKGLLSCQNIVVILRNSSKGERYVNCTPRTPNFYIMQNKLANVSKLHQHMTQLFKRKNKLHHTNPLVNDYYPNPN